MSLLLWAIFGGFLALIQFASPDILDNDGYYHIKLAYLMRTEGLKPAFEWLPLSILNQREFYDHHFLFHVALMPFTFGDLRVGAKWAAVLFASLAFLSTWNLLKNQRIPYSELWALGLMALSEAFIYRMSIPRAQSLSLAALMLGLDWLLRRKHLSLAILAFFFVWFYDAFPLLLIFSGVFVLANWLVQREWELRPLIYTASGLAAGMIINPYFPYNILFTIQHILPKLLDTTAVSVGNEWYPYTTAQLLENSPLALVAFASGALALGFSAKKIDLRTLASFLIAALSGLLLLQSRRFIEYFPPFALVFAAFAWSPILEQARNLEQKPLRRWFTAALIAALLVPGIWMTLAASRENMQTAKPHETYASASAWLAENTPAGERIFQSDWDDFPRLFFYNTHNTYLVGLDPTYMLLYDESLYNIWVNISRGEIENPSKVILEEFGASYVLTDLRHGNFLKQVEQDNAMIEVFRDEFAAVYKINAR